MFELPQSGIEEKKVFVSSVIEISCGFQCQRSPGSLAVHFRTRQSVQDGFTDVGFKPVISELKKKVRAAVLTPTQINVHTHTHILTLLSRFI